MIEQLDVYPGELEDPVWVADIPCGPSLAGIRALREIQARYGSCNVTTGNASEGATGLVCGVYVRADVVGDEPNFLRDYLSRD